ncbi:hypothetical protein KC336_g22755, partial [Hortaea werneckii]
MTSIRTEISENGAGSTRTTGSEILPRDRALVWNVSLLSMCVVHVGRDVLDLQEELFDLANFMQDHCRGIPLVHVSNFVHHLLLNLTVTYTMDYRLFEKQEMRHGGLTPDCWGKVPDPAELNINWHVPSHEEIDFAVKVFEAQAGRALKALRELIKDDGSVIKRDGVGKDWSDEMSRNLVLLRLTISGCSRLFRSEDGTVSPEYTMVEKEISGEEMEVEGVGRNGKKGTSADEETEDDLLGLGPQEEDEKVKRTFH